MLPRQSVHLRQKCPGPRAINPHPPPHTRPKGIVTIVGATHPSLPSLPCSSDFPTLEQVAASQPSPAEPTPRA
jgi:hypothetical protein